MGMPLSKNLIQSYREAAQRKLAKSVKEGESDKVIGYYEGLITAYRIVEKLMRDEAERITISN